VSWWRRDKCKNKEGIAAAEGALQREKKASEDAEAKRPAVNDLADELAKHRRENNFSRLIEDAMHLRKGSR